MYIYTHISCIYTHRNVDMNIKYITSKSETLNPKPSTPHQVHLYTLHLDNNYLANINPVLARLTSLTDLSLSHNFLSKVPCSVLGVGCRV